jgi:glutamyl-tRNA synthetase
MIHTQIAPSPTGDMHIGTARTAYFNWLSTRAPGGKFFLRIDDTDKERNKEEYTNVIFETLSWLGLDYDDLLFQSKQTYQHALNRLPTQKLENGAVALCLENQIIPSSWQDEIAGPVKITDTDILQTQKMVLIKADGMPTYNFASVVNDIEMGINYIIRGVDHTVNTAKQAILFHLLDAPLPKFAHLGLIVKNHKPLSKRDGSASMLSYKQAGYDPDAMLNFLARIGWGPSKDDKSTAILPREKMLEMLWVAGKMHNSPVNFDLAKLESFDRKYKGRKRTKEKLCDT